MKKVIMTGATGFIGYHLLSELIYNGIEVWVVCRETNPCVDILSKSSKIHIIPCSLSNIKYLPDKCSERDFDVFYHIAWEGASGSMRADYNIQLNNVLWTGDCIQAAQQMNCGKIVITGTVCEYQTLQMTKENIYPPSAYYLTAKKQAHEIADAISSRIGMSMIWCQFYHPIGVYNKKNQIISSTMVKLLNGDPLEFGSASGLFDVIDVSDLVHALILMGEKSLLYKQYMVGTNKFMTLRYYLDIMQKSIDLHADMKYGAISTVELEMKKEWLDASLFMNEVNFIPNVSFETSIRNMKNWLENEEYYNTHKWDFLF